MLSAFYECFLIKKLDFYSIHKLKSPYQTIEMKKTANNKCVI